MKSNKQRYNESRNGKKNNGSGDNPLMWLIVLVAIVAFLISTKSIWCNAIGMCHDDLSIGTYNPLSNGIGEQR